jgi:two-component system response regulator RegA
MDNLSDELSSDPKDSLLIVEDDRAFAERLRHAMARRGFDVQIAASVEDGLLMIQSEPPGFAIVDMRLKDGSGLDVVARLKESKPDARAIILTGYGNLATTVTAVKLGATDYLAKPADADDIYAALKTPPGRKPEPPRNPKSADRVRWEHIQSVFKDSDRNVSQTARRLNMHRRTLQRILAKRPPH